MRRCECAGVSSTRDRDDLWRETHERALRHSTWIALVAAQDLGHHEIAGQLTSVLVHIDEVREGSGVMIP